MTDAEERVTEEDQRQACSGIAAKRIKAMQQQFGGKVSNRPNIRDWSLITGRGGGGLQNGKIAGPKLFAPPPPQDRVKLFAPPLLKSGNFLCPPTIWLKLQPTT